MKAVLSFLVFSVIVALPSAVARAENIEVLFDGTGVEVWDVARDAERLRREFSVSEVKAATNPPALDWRFVSRGVAFNDLFLRRPIARDFTSIRVRIRNEGAAFTLAAKVREASGAEWTTPRIALDRQQRLAVGRVCPAGLACRRVGRVTQTGEWISRWSISR